VSSKKSSSKVIKKTGATQPSLSRWKKSLPTSARYRGYTVKLLLKTHYNQDGTPSPGWAAIAKRKSVIFAPTNREGQLYIKRTPEGALENMCELIDKIFNEETDVNHNKELMEVFDE
jgi:hypothetical protein